MFIHERENWTAFRWDAERIAPLLSKADRSIAFLAGRLSTVGFDTQMAATVESVTRDVVYSSEIEGISLNTEEVRSSVARHLGVKVLDTKEPTHYIEGIVEMMLDATQNHNIPLTESRLMGWHSALFPTGHSGSEEIHVGSYRTEGMQVISGMFGRERVHYRAPEPELVQGEMDKFLAWLSDESVPASLVKSAIAHFWFVCIHPFDDGNGRIARAISDMVLAQADGSKFRYYSQSMQICKDKKEYYRILERTSRGDGDITDWLCWYLECLCRAAQASEETLSGVLRKSLFWRTFADVSVTERQSTVLNTYLDGYDAKLTAKNWAKVAKVSTDTALRDIRDLVDKGILTPVEGRVRDISYNINYVRESGFAAKFSDAKVMDMDGRIYLAALFEGSPLKERLSEIDKQRYDAGEITLDDLLYKYFSYLLD